MSTISLFTPIYYLRPTSNGEKALSTLSHYFNLKKGIRVTVVKGNEVYIENTKPSWKIIALKVASYILFTPLSLSFLVVYSILHSKYHFTIIKPNKNPDAGYTSLKVERESLTPINQPESIRVEYKPRSVSQTFKQPQQLSPLIRERGGHMATSNINTSFRKYLAKCLKKNNSLFSPKVEFNLKLEEIRELLLINVDWSSLICFKK